METQEQSLLLLMEPPYADPHVRWCGGCGQQWPRLPDFAAVKEHGIVTRTAHHGDDQYIALDNSEVHDVREPRKPTGP